MVIRVLPASKGGIYSNAGSSSYLVTYLEHEARDEKLTDRAIFFNQVTDGIAAEEVQERIDSNIQGLQKGKPGFHSLVISPSQDELRHLDNDLEKVKAYTRQVMENYAATFTDKRKRTQTSADLVWYATIHRSRHYSGLDDDVQTGQAKLHQAKQGEQTHVHIIVSARDKSMSRSLHPDAGSQRFNYRDWQARNLNDFERNFGYRQVVTEQQHRQRLDRLVNRLDRAGLSLDKDRIATIGKQHNYSSDFWKRMAQIERGVKRGSIFTQNQAYEQIGKEPDLRTNHTRPIADERVISPGLLIKSIAVKTNSRTEDRGGATIPPINIPANATDASNAPQKAGITTNQQTNTNEQHKGNRRAGRTDISPLLNALRLESVPETGEHVQTQADDFRRKIRRRR